MISDDKPVTVNWKDAPAVDRRAGATFETARSGSLAAIEEALGNGARILAYARITVDERTEAAADPGEVEVLPPSGTGSGQPIVAIGCHNGFVHVYVGVEDETAMMSVLTHDVEVLGAPC
jgi:hypothetical protein